MTELNDAQARLGVAAGRPVDFYGCDIAGINATATRRELDQRSAAVNVVTITVALRGGNRVTRMT